MSSIQQRKEEILAKKAKLAELKKQRELRQREFTSHRQSLDVGEVCKSQSCKRLETD
jgi:dynein intermediate chain